MANIPGSKYVQSRFPGEELRWDKASLTFTNNEQATNTIVRRQYRDGFAPPPVV